MFSKTTNKVLSIFIANSGERFYLRRLCALTGISPRPVQLALAGLENEGILKAQREANIKFYSLNEDCPILTEIKSIILKTEAADGLLSRGFKGLKNIKCAFIYGSVAKGKERKGSDIDICVIGNVDLGNLSKVTSRLEKRLKREISVVTFGADEWRKAVADKKAFAMDILKNKKIILAGNLDGA